MLNVSLALKGVKLSRYEIKVNNKLQFTHTVGQCPHGKGEIDILKEMASITGLRNTGLIKPRIYEAPAFSESVAQSPLNNRVQMNLNLQGIPTPENLLMHKIVLVDPAPELLVKRHVFDQEKYRNLPRCPAILQEQLDYIRRKPAPNAKEREEHHIAFWETVMGEQRDKKGTERSGIGRLINWTLERSQDAIPDAYVPISPHITNHNPKQLLEMAIEVNDISQEIVKSNVVPLISVDASVFQHKRIIQEIAEYLDRDRKQGMYALKIQDYDSLVNYSYGKIALRNLEYLLTVIKHIKEISVDGERKIFGLLNGNGFGFSLSGLFDFFVADVGNFEYGWKAEIRKTHRGCIHPESLKVEPFEYWEECVKSGEIPAVYHPYHKYHNMSPRDFIKERINPTEWRKDCKMSGINMWDIFNEENMKAIASPNNNDSVSFDRIQNSAYSNLVPLIRKVMES